MAKIIEAIRQDQWPWTPVRRLLQEQPKGGKRPRGRPLWSDTVGQALVRSRLEAYDEPPCSTQSHGFRPPRGGQTARTEIHHVWIGPTWFIAGDIKGCCEHSAHTILMHILPENMQDNRLLRLMEGALTAGYGAAWTSHPARSGSPPGGRVSPLLSHLDRDR
jgi:retron-type reverse transcriptase